MNHPHLVMPDPSLRTRGTLARKESFWTITAEPAVLEVARRVFPGCHTGERTMVKFPDSRRQVEELLWLMQRFPLEMAPDVREYLGQRRRLCLELAGQRQQRVERKIDVSASFRGTLLPYQPIGAAFLVDNRKCLLADDMGLGKTVQTIAALASADAWPAIIVGETNIIKQWMAQLEVFLQARPLGTPWAHQITGTKITALPEAPAYILHYGLLRHWADALLALNPRVLIFDEIQNLRKLDSKKYSAASRLSDGVEYVWGLSGTPIYNYGMEIWAIFNAIDHMCLGSREGFQREWATGYQSEIIEKPVELGDYLKSEGLMLRRMKADVATDLPPVRRIVQRIDHDEGVFKELIGHALDLVAEFDASEDRLEKGRLSRMIDTETRRATGVSKAPTVAEFVNSLIDAGERPLVYSHHHQVHDIILEAVKKADAHRDGNRRADPIEITGRITQGQKAENIAKFSKGEAKCAILGLRSTAGLDGLQGMGTCTVFAELDWSPAVHAQCEARLQRIGTGVKDSILSYYLVCGAGTDEQQQEALGLKVSQFKELMGDKEIGHDEAALGEQIATKRMQAVIEVLRKMKKKRGAACTAEAGTIAEQTPQPA